MLDFWIPSLSQKHDMFLFVPPQPDTIIWSFLSHLERTDGDMNKLPFQLHIDAYAYNPDQQKLCLESLLCNKTGILMFTIV